MHFIIMGCGRVGALVADRLDADGHSVSIIDQNPGAFDRLGPGFAGQRVVGSGFDRGTLIKAQISKAYAFAALSNGDNSNIIAARTAAEEFGVEHVVARVADPERASLFERLGIPTIASSARVSTAVMGRILPPNARTAWTHPAGTVSLVAVRPGPSWRGQSFASVEAATGGKVAFVARLSEVALATGREVVQKEDELFIALEGSSAREIRDILESEPGGTHA